MNFMCLYVDGVQVPSKPLTPDFDKHLYADAYRSLFTGSENHFLNEGNGIARRDYPNGYCLFAFDLTSDISANNMAH